MENRAYILHMSQQVLLVFIDTLRIALCSRLSSSKDDSTAVLCCYYSQQSADLYTAPVTAFPFNLMLTVDTDVTPYL